ncbi:MAG: hypothetical protein QOD44_2129 [Solirubrobacteraceae bacterium]|jgi:hypothetical protein|nr:hypothetical protein [Solirubrobacteraceae bacterium]
MVTTMERAREIYDQLPPDRGADLRRLNAERLAELEARGAARRARIARAVAAQPAPPADED